MIKNITSVCDRITDLESYPIQDSFNLIQNINPEKIKGMCQNDKSFYQTNMSISQKQIAQTSSTTISEFQQHLIDLDEKERQLYDTITIVAFIVLIGGSCISLFRCTKCSPSKIQKDLVHEKIKTVS